MTKDVILSISGLQLEVLEEETDNESIEVIAPASYFFKDGSHYIFYEEVAEGISGVTKNKIKITDNRLVEIRKTGMVNTQMVFEKDKKNLTYYDTPYGQLMLGVDTTYMKVNETENDIDIRIEYDLDINHSPLAECVVRMNVKAKDSGTFSMREGMK